MKWKGKTWFFAHKYIVIPIFFWGIFLRISWYADQDFLNQNLWCNLPMFLWLSMTHGDEEIRQNYLLKNFFPFEKCINLYHGCGVWIQYFSTNKKWFNILLYNLHFDFYCNFLVHRDQAIGNNTQNYCNNNNKNGQKTYWLLQ